MAFAGFPLTNPSCLEAATPTTVSYTAPTEPVGTASATQTATLSMANGFTLGSIAVVTQGASNLDFNLASGGTCVVGTAYTAGQNCTVNYTFRPTAPGERLGAINLYDTTTPVPVLQAVAFLNGIGTGPQISFGPGAASAIDPTVNGMGLSKTQGAVVDAAGDLFIGDPANARVVKVPAGGGAPVAINGLAPYLVYGVAVDGAGNLFISTFSNAVVEIPAGVGTPVAFTPTVNGGSLDGAFGMALDDAGDLFIADTLNNRLVEVPAGGGAAVAINPTANGEALSLPFGVAVDGAGDVFIADTGNSRVVEVMAGTNPAMSISIAPTVAGIGLSNPEGVALDGVRDLFIADTGNGRVVEVPVGGGTPVAFAPTADGIGLSSVVGVTVDATDDLFIVDSSNSRVVELLRSQPPALSFASTPVGSTSIDSPQTVTIQNIGSTPLTFEIPTSGYNPSISANFALNSSGASACPIVAAGSSAAGTLAVGVSCKLQVSFNPTTGGTLSGNITLTDNALNAAAPGYAVQTIKLSGTGLAPLVSLSATSVSFGSQELGTTSASQSVTMTNSGAATLLISSIAVTGTGASSFVFANNCGTNLTAGASCTIHGHFTPTVAGTSNATVTITDNAVGSPQQISLSGTGTLPVVSLSGTGVLFGNQAVGTTSASQPVTMTNTGSATLVISSIIVTGTNQSSFSLSHDCGNTLAAGASCKIQAQFAPAALGSLSAAISITDNAAGSPQSITLGGTGVAPVTSFSASSLSFGGLLIGTTSTSQLVTLTNTGDATLSIANIGLTGPDTSSFVFANDCGISLAAGASCTIHGHFTPMVAGPLDAAITISDNAGGSPQTIALTGLGYNTTVSLSATSLLYGFQEVETSSSSQSVTLTNTGAETLSIASISLTGPNASSFDFANTCGTSLAPGASCTIHGHFAPATTGQLTAVVSIGDTGNGSPQSIAVTGTGYGPTTASLSATSLSFGNETVGATSTSREVALTNTGNATLYFTSIDVTGPDASSFVFANNCGTSLTGGASCTIHGHFTPAAGGALTAAVVIADSATGSPKSISLSGSGVNPPGTLSATSLSFGDLEVGTTSASQSVMFTNNGSVALAITSVNVTGADSSSFVFASDCGSGLVAGASCTIHGHFTPTSAGLLTAAVTITDSTSGSPQSVSLTGTGYLPTTISLSATSLSFGNETVGVTSASQQVTLTNTGGSPFAISSIALTGAGASSFVFANSCGSSLAAGASCLIHGHFTPAVSGDLTAVVKVTGNASNSPQLVSISGTGTPPAPAITGFSPASGVAGTIITVTGANLIGLNAATPQVMLAQQGGGSINAPVSAFTAASLSFVIPAGAATGPIEVMVGANTATSVSNLTVTTSSGFTLGVTPASVNLIPGQSLALAVSISTSNGFTGAAALSVNGLPSGVTASFQPTSIAVGQTATLSLAAPASQAVAKSTLTITGSATIQGQSVMQSAPAMLQVTGITTSFLGRTVVDDAQQEPIAGVTVKFLGVDNKGNTTSCSGQTVSDGGGNFQFTNLPTGCTGPQLISYNGLTATSPVGTYAGVNLYYTLVSGQAVASPVLVHLPRIDNAETVMVQQNAPTDQVFYFQSIPNLKVTVYAHTTLALDDKSTPTPFPLIAIEIPIDRLPDAMPTSEMLNPFIVAFQPANASANQPVSVNFPNALNMLPGTVATFMTLDPTRGSMVPYGMGMVSSDGTEFVADPDPAHPGHGYGLIHFDWHGPAPAPPSSINPSQEGAGGPGTGGGNATNPSGCTVGCPVDVSSGIVEYTATDLQIGGGRGSISIDRYFRTLTTNPGPFGVGTSLSYDYSLNTYKYINGGSTITLALPNGNQFLMSQTPNGTFVNTTVPSLIGAVLTANGPSGPYTLRWANGTQYQFTVFTSLGFAGAFLTSITDLNGNTTTLTLNPSTPQQIQKITDPVGRSFTLTYDGSNRVTQVTDSIGRTVKYSYNPQGYLQTFTDANNGMTNYTYDSANNLATITDPRGKVTETNTYNTGYDNRIIQQVAADGGVYQFAYAQLCGSITLALPQANGIPPQIAGCMAADPVLETLVTDPLGNQTLYRFNSQGFLISATDPTGQTRTLTRDPAHNNLVSSYTGAGTCPVCGNIAAGNVSYTFDQFGNVLTRADALGNTTTFTYDTRFNKVNSITDPLNHATSITYNANGNPIAITDANGNSTQLAFDSFGELIQITDPKGYKTNIGYDSYGNISSVTDALGHTSNLIYDAVSRLTRVVDALGRNSTASYDALNRVMSETDAHGNTTSFSYDQIGDLISFKDAKNNLTQYTYDSVGRLQSRISPLNKTEYYTWDVDSNLVQYTDRRGLSSTFTYDVLNRVVKESFTDSTVTGSYDANSRLISVNDSLGGIFDFAYDADGHLLTQDEPTGIVNYTRDPLGRVATRQVAGQAAVTYGYDAVGNMLSAATSAAGVTYAYDPRNLPESLTRTNGVVTNYNFDALGQVLSIVHNMGSNALNTQSYIYDAVGNRSIVGNDISQALITPSATATVGNGNELLANGGTAYTYDANGNRLTEASATDTLTYTWDGRNRLSSIKDASGDTTTLHYDFGRNLLGVTKTTGAVTTTRSFVVDSLTNVVSLTGPSGSTVSVLTGRSIDSHFASVDAAGDIAFGIGDALGSITGVTDGSGNLAAKFDYEPFGQTTGTGDDTYPFAYTGRASILGNIIYYRNRFYDAGTGRFLSEDPIGLRGGVNSYAYVRNNPINWLDPLGMCGSSNPPLILGPSIGVACSAAGPFSLGPFCGGNNGAVNGASGGNGGDGTPTIQDLGGGPVISGAISGTGQIIENAGAEILGESLVQGGSLYGDYLLLQDLKNLEYTVIDKANSSVSLQ